MTLLIYQFMKLNVAFKHIGECNCSNFATVRLYHRLIIDLEEYLNKCSGLITFMSHHISKLSWTQAKPLKYSRLQKDRCEFDISKKKTNRKRRSKKESKHYVADVIIKMLGF